jgi:hypothetical protein
MKSKLLLILLFVVTNVILSFFSVRLLAQDVSQDTSLTKAQKPYYGALYIGVGGFNDREGLSGDLTLEARGRITRTSNFFFGLRFQLDFTPRFGYTSTCVSGDYYVSRSKNGLRTFVGAGFGGFNELRQATASFDNIFNLNESNFGFFPRIGIESGSFRLSGEYNFTGGINNYAAINVGFLLGGGGKK